MLRTCTYLVPIGIRICLCRMYALLTGSQLGPEIQLLNEGIKFD